MRGKYQRPSSGWLSRLSRLMRNSQFRGGLGLGATASLLVVCLIVWNSLSGSVAWFANNKSVTGDGMQIQAETLPPIPATVTAYEVTGLSNNVLSFSLTGTEVDGEQLAVAMPKFQLLNDSQRYLLLHFHLDEAVEGMDLSVYTDTDYFMDTDHPLLPGDGTSADEDYVNAMTSIVQFAKVDAPTVTDSALEVSLPSQADFQSYVDKTSIPTVTGGYLTLAEDFGTDAYILIAYDPDLIIQIYSNNIGSPVLEGQVGEESYITYVMDFSFELILTSP